MYKELLISLADFITNEKIYSGEEIPIRDFLESGVTEDVTSNGVFFEAVHVKGNNSRGNILEDISGKTKDGYEFGIIFYLREGELTTIEMHTYGDRDWGSLELEGVVFRFSPP